MTLTSSYSYLAYMYLRLNEHKGSWTVPLDELQTVLGYKAKKSKRLENGEKIQDYAQNFKYFNRDILKMAQSELAEKMDYHFTYEPVRRSRAVVAIRFTVSIAAPLPPKPDKAQLPGQTSFLTMMMQPPSAISLRLLVFPWVAPSRNLRPKKSTCCCPLYGLSPKICYRLTPPPEPTI